MAFPLIAFSLSYILALAFSWEKYEHKCEACRALVEIGTMGLSEADLDPFVQMMKKLKLDSLPASSLDDHMIEGMANIDACSFSDFENMPSDMRSGCR